MADGTKSAPAPIRLEFTVWQFVRVMVRLEKVGQKSAAWRAWWKDWTKLDRRLERLAKTDRAAYSRLMMDEEVVIADATPAEAADVLRALDAVIGEMGAELAKDAELDDETLASLAFERDELIALRADIRKRAPAAARSRSRSRGRPKAPGGKPGPRS